MSWFRIWRRKRAADGQGVRAAHTRLFGGRQFTRGVPYILPSDSEEINRLDFQHYMLRYALKGNYAAPLKEPHKILDIACGTGRWCIEMATHFPQADVVGFDITPPPAAGGDTPHPHPFAFVQGNMLEGLPFANNSFDFVHQRLVIVALPTTRWVSQIHEMLRITRPGGWIELIDGDLLPGGPGLQTLNALAEQMSQKRGMSFSNASKIGEYMQQAGARLVEQRVVHLPVGKITGRLGGMAEVDYLAIYASVRGFLIAQSMITEEQYEQAHAHVRAELASGTLTWPFYVAYGRK